MVGREIIRTPAVSVMICMLVVGSTSQRDEARFGDILPLGKRYNEANCAWSFLTVIRNR